MPTTKLDIHPRFQQLIRPLSEDELSRLETSLLEHGLLDSIKLWPYKGKRFIIDGHHRYGLIDTHGKKITGFKTEELEFPDEDAVCEWIIDHQLQRRNVNPNERALYLGQLFELRKKRQGGLRKDEEGGNTAEQIAEEMNVSPRTVTRAAEVVEAYNQVDPEMQQKFITGDISQAELIRTITEKQEEKRVKRDKTRNSVTEAFRTTGEKILREIRALRSRADDLQLICDGAGLEASEIAPNLFNLANKFKQEEKQAESLTTMVYVKNLCPNKGSDTKCRSCKSVEYVTETELEGLKPHFGITEKAKAATAE
jgi:hypothetical protein